MQFCDRPGRWQKHNIHNIVLVTATRRTPDLHDYREIVRHSLSSMRMELRRALCRMRVRMLCGRCATDMYVCCCGKWERAGFERMVTVAA
jgi:hypothetical protein